MGDYFKVEGIRSAAAAFATAAVLATAFAPGASAMLAPAFSAATFAQAELGVRGPGVEGLISSGHGQGQLIAGRYISGCGRSLNG